jgi:methylated-DNA-[protein]-cysteine S-methyltransferase
VPALRTVLDTPIGQLALEADGDTLVGAEFHATGRAGTDEHLTPLLKEACRELRAYFAGNLREFSVPLAPRGTAFQLTVWSALRQIPYGETRSYRDLAASVGRPAAIRAVGAANGRNPIPIFIPCHRVIGSDGRLVGFGGGIETKRKLLDLEQGGRLF